MDADGITKPRIGLVAETDLNRHLLAAILDETGYDLTVSLDPQRLASRVENGDLAELDKQVDAWLLDVRDYHIQSVLDLLVDGAEKPLLVNDEIPPPLQADTHQYWKRRLIEKLELFAVAGANRAQSTAEGVPPPFVWLLAASFGGPEAVKQFLQALPAALPLSLVYGQHIDKQFDRFLTDALGAKTSYPARLIRGRHILQAGQLAIVPADREVRFTIRGEAIETRRSWSGQYQPVLDQVIAEMARVYRQRLGVIVFSGMCNDGEIGCRVANACGSRVWVQSPASCMSDDMPNAALKTGSVSFQGTPEELARELATLVSTEAGMTGTESNPRLDAGLA